MKQINKLIEYVKSIFNRPDKKKLIENCVVVVIIGVIVIIAGGTLFDKKDGGTPPAAFNGKEENRVDTQVSANINKAGAEKELAAILEQIRGAGRVDVMVTYISSGEIVPAYDIRQTEDNTNEKDTNGGTRSIIGSSYESDIAYEEVQSGIKRPIVLKELQPKVKGVVVVADGASDPVVCGNLTRAVQVLMDVPIHKIQVFERKK